MPLSRDFRITVRARLKRDQAFRGALLAEVKELQHVGEAETADAILRDYLEVAAR